MAAVYLPWVEDLCRRFDGSPHLWRARYEALVAREPSPLEAKG
jgi:hypothetical protein